ncbi:hypothetical protein GGX14DRAFT_480607 [Mycena pura]|uniref:DUF6533 domain-containing protein n=1 Tax=Mycena pura TaxID=153505 RepID=A0AAD6XXF3_9AGAR|nr:hypothetical protein GGX14DRAFT_485101 [Mycena pura]KAJ7189402.1 hypothetical protein GGX14DRAFT_485119 [Mycena pura]KAJ7192019.1 hypothetical protein GGX14DRAFT_480607 [Mycena pura]
MVKSVVRDSALTPPFILMSNVSQFLHTISAVQVCTTSVLIWDWLFCLPQEWRCIWKSGRWSSIKCLYIMVRYYMLLVLVGDTCARYVRLLPGIAVLVDLSIEIFALYGRQRKIAIFLIAMLAIFLGVMIAVPILAFDYTRLPSWPGPCIVTGKPSIAGPKFIIAFYASPMTCDMIMTAMTVYRAIEQNRSGPSSLMLNRMARDGLFYFFAITSLNLLNVIFFIQSDELIQAINAPMSIQISSVLCCRLILNLRAQGDNLMSVKMFSHSRGQFDAPGRFADVIHENLVVGEIQFSPGQQPFSPSVPLNSTQTTQDVVIHFEREAQSASNADSYKFEEGENELEADVQAKCVIPDVSPV